MNTIRPATFDTMIAALAEPFPADSVGWKPQVLSADRKRCLAVAYIDARTVMARLDAVVGPSGWQSDVRPTTGGGVYVGIGLQHPDSGSWLWRWDAGKISSLDRDESLEIKGDFSDGFKRAAVQWTIFRYAYALPRRWCDYDDQRKQIVNPPALPTWAVPGGSGRPSVAVDGSDHETARLHRGNGSASTTAPSLDSVPPAGTESEHPTIAVEQDTPDEPIPSPRDVEVHFGSNRGLHLGDLKPRQLQWYAFTWVPARPGPADQALKAAAIALAEDLGLQPPAS